MAGGSYRPRVHLRGPQGWSWCGLVRNGDPMIGNTNVRSAVTCRSCLHHLPEREPCDRRCGFDTVAGHQPCATCREMDAVGSGAAGAQDRGGERVGLAAADAARDSGGSSDPTSVPLPTMAVHEATASDLLHDLVALWDADRLTPDPERTLDQFIEQSVAFSARRTDLHARVRAFVEADRG